MKKDPSTDILIEMAPIPGQGKFHHFQEHSFQGQIIWPPKTQPVNVNSYSFIFSASGINENSRACRLDPRIIENQRRHLPFKAGIWTGDFHRKRLRWLQIKLGTRRESRLTATLA
ncbi:hypothetical protein [Burkholderia sp. RS02]|uniref:hypothetical protein n=1 Tax=unclassified Burkholderia TaxID=2613784 RepID=UPI0032185741